MQSDVDTFRERLKEFGKTVVEWLVAIGAPLPFIEVLSNYFGISESLRNRLALGVTAFFVIILSLWKFNSRLRDALSQRTITTLVWIGAATLAVSSIILFISTTQSDAGRWQRWEHQLLLTASKCVPDDVQCLSQAIADSINSEPRTRSGKLTDQIRYDVDAGSVIADSAVFVPLLKRFSISPQFLGTGFSAPVSATSYGDARVPEFLIPNYPDSNPAVFVWKLEPDELDSTLSDVLTKLSPLAENGGGPDHFKSEFSDVLSQHLALADPTPAIIRFAAIPGGLYSHCLGRRGGIEVFGSHLGVLLRMNLTVRQAAEYSGYLFSQSPATTDFFVFVYLPTTANEVTVPTWGNLLSKIHDLVQRDAPLCAS